MSVVHAGQYLSFEAILVLQFGQGSSSSLPDMRATIDYAEGERLGTAFSA